MSWRLAAGQVLLAALGALAATPTHRKVLPVPAVAPGGSGTITVGTLQLTRCGLAYCGVLPRPLDPTGQVPGTIDIGFQFYPQTNPSLPALGALVATEGGPGYATTGSASEYLGLFQPLLDQRSLLLMDNRGTGTSGAPWCTPLQSQALYTEAAIQACGAELGDTSYLYGTGLAVDDLAAVIAALELPPVDLYGDSYGTYFSQAFAGRHPAMLRSLVLDSAWPVVGESPWYPEAPPAANSAFNLACQRSPTCSSQPGVSMDRIDSLLDSVRANPVSGTAPNGDGTPVPVTANAQGLAYVMFSNASGPVVYRELDAAARAWLNNGDQAPFLRLIAENQEAAYGASGFIPPAELSSALFVAVSCTDYPQIYSMTSPLAVRAYQGQNAIAQEQMLDPNVFAPFTIDEFLLMPLDYSVVNLCLRWPVPAPAYPPGQPVPAGTVFPGMPAIVLSGDLDSLTPAAQAAQAAALFPAAQHIVFENSFHVTALADPYHCASSVVRNFVETLSPGDTSCASATPEVRLVPQFALASTALAPATALAGNQGTAADLQAAAAAAYTAGDALARFWVNYDKSGVGLRGGTFTYRYAGTTIEFQLSSMRWTQDVSVSGSVSWNVTATGAVQADLTVTGPGSSSGQLTVTYQNWTPLSMATLTGTFGGRAIAATMYAP
jgi:pimeloyl-ACP methyl ester carboxylesterase